MRPHLRVLLPLAGAAALLLPAAAAHADTYSVFTCKGPAGQPLVTGPWVGSRESDAFASNDCPTGGPLAVGLTGSGPYKGGIGGEQRFTAPPATRVVSVRLNRRTSGLPGAKGLAYYLYADDTIVDRCDPASTTCTADLDGNVELTGLNAGVIRFKAGCFESFPDVCLSSGTPLRAEVPQAVLGIRDAVVPAVASPTGTLASAGTGVKGKLGVTFNASDVGGGLYRILTTVDGVTTPTPVAAGDCTDAAPTDADPYQFTVAVPCPPSVNGLTATVDTTGLSNGTHSANVLIEDAAGNRTTVVGARTFTVDNPLPPAAPGEGPPNGVGADVKGVLRLHFDVNNRKKLRNRYGRRVVIRGFLRDRNGKGIERARVAVYHRLRGQSRRLFKTGMRSRSGGKLTLILPLDLTTRQVLFTYSARIDGRPVTRQTLGLTVLDRNGRVVTKRKGKLGRIG